MRTTSDAVGSAYAGQCRRPLVRKQDGLDEDEKQVGALSLVGEGFLATNQLGTDCEEREQQSLDHENAGAHADDLWQRLRCAALLHDTVK